jgi:hypothetical protein
MAVREKVKQGSAAGTVLVAYDAKKRSLPVWLVRNARWAREAPLSETQRTWLEQQGFKGTARKLALLPGPDGALAGAVLGLGEERGGDPLEKAELAGSCRPAATTWPTSRASRSWRLSPGGSAPTASGATSPLAAMMARS